jgi:predicted O-methyltransferase YrrM
LDEAASRCSTHELRWTSDVARSGWNTVNTSSFLQAVAPLLKRSWQFYRLRRHLERAGLVSAFDPCPDVAGMASPRKLRLLSLAVAALPGDGSECYLEIGTYQGKSLIAALQPNPNALGVACDDFSLFDDTAQPVNLTALNRNLAAYGLKERVRFFNCDFRMLLAQWKGHGLPAVGVYFYDGAHDEESQYLGLTLAEAVLADEALVLVDDWRRADDSGSFAEAGTRRAIADSSCSWSIEHVLPARFNGDMDQWWNGVGVLVFRRRPGLNFRPG